MRKPLEIPELTAAEAEALDTLYRTTRDVRLRTRAQIVLLAGEQRLTAPAIARIVRESDQTVRTWLKRWLAEGVAGLQDRPMPGGPRKITADYREQLLAAVRQRPRCLGRPYSLWTLQRLADYLAELTGLRLTYETVRVALKAGGIVLSRPQHTVSSPDPEYRVKNLYDGKLILSRLYSASLTLATAAWRNGMARRTARPAASHEYRLEPYRRRCVQCGGPAHIAYHSRRTIMTLDGLYRLVLAVRRCQEATCPLYRQPYRPEEEGGWALPHGEFGLDVIALVGALRYGEHRSVPEIHQHLVARGIAIAERTVTHLVQRYEELVTLRLTDRARLRERLAQQGRVILALDGLRPDVGHEVLWVLRDCLSGEILLARSLLSGTQGDLAALLQEVREVLPVPIHGVISDGQQPIRTAVAAILPGVPHQLCQFHYLREAAKPIFEADRHAKVHLKKAVRAVRPIERALEGREDDEAAAIRGYCLAVRSALTDDGHPPLCASGLKLHDRLAAIHASIGRVGEKGGSPSRWPTSTASSPTGSRPPPPTGRPSARPIAGSTRPRTSSPTTTTSRTTRSAPTTRRCYGRWASSRRLSARSGVR
jgi:transposase